MPIQNKNEQGRANHIDVLKPHCPALASVVIFIGGNCGGGPCFWRQTAAAEADLLGECSGSHRSDRSRRGCRGEQQPHHEARGCNDDYGLGWIGSFHKRQQLLEWQQLHEWQRLGERQRLDQQYREYDNDPAISVGDWRHGVILGRWCSHL